MQTPTQPAFRIVANELRPGLLFQVLARPQQIHRGVLGHGAQAVLFMTQDVILNTLGTLMMLARTSEYVRTDGFQGREAPPCVVPVKAGSDAPAGAACRVIVEASRTEGHGDLAMLTVELPPERVASLAERLLRRGGLRRVCLVDGGRIAWEEGERDDGLISDKDLIA